MNRQYFHTWTAQNEATDLEIDKSNGSYFLHEENKILDFTSISFHANWGHSHPHINEKVKKQMEDFSVTSSKSKFPLKDRVSKKLVDLVGIEGKVFYTVSGAEANENAVKIIRQTTGKRRILACQNSYHGATLGALALTGDWRREDHLTPDDFVTHLPNALEDPDFSQAEKMLSSFDLSDIAAVIWETVSGVNGVIKPGKLWWEKMNAWREKYDVKLILDEVLCGFYRCSYPLAFHGLDNVIPDMVSLSKGITGGHIPFGALWVNSDMASFYENKVLSCGLTSYAHPLGLAACDGVFDLIEEPAFTDSLKKSESCFANEIKKLSEKVDLLNYRVEGMLGILNFKSDLKVSAKDFLDEGLYLIVKKNCILLSPSFILSEEQIAWSINCIEKVLKEKNG